MGKIDNDGRGTNGMRRARLERDEDDDQNHGTSQRTDVRLDAL